VKSKHQPLLVFSLAAVLGALICLLSPWLAGHREPWDAQSHYYVCALLIAGFLPACLSTGSFILSALGVWFGQTATVLFAFVLFTQPRNGPDNGLWMVGLASLFFQLGPAVAGAFLGEAAHIGFRRLRSHASKVA
jgi:uncharacterized membrane protein